MVRPSCVTESLFLGGPKGDPDICRGGGGGLENGNYFFPITFIVHNQKSNWGPMEEPMV